MDFMELAKKRYSVRKFSDKPVEKEKLEQILEAGNIAPTANLEHSHLALFLVVFANIKSSCIFTIKILLF